MLFINVFYKYFYLHVIKNHYTATDVLYAVMFEPVLKYIIGDYITPLFNPLYTMTNNYC